MLPQVVMSGIYTVGYFAALGLLMTGHVNIPTEHVVMVTTVMGVLTGAQAQILSYWFGGGPKETQGRSNV